MPRTVPKNRPSAPKRATPWKPPHAGIGRKKGVPNIVTSTVRGIFTEFVENNVAGAQVLYDRVAKKNPAKALETLTRIAEFVVPKLNRTELTSAGTPMVSANPINDANEAANVYVAIMGNSKIDLAMVCYQPPTPAEPVAVQDAPVRPHVVEPINPGPDLPRETADNVVSIWERLSK